MVALRDARVRRLLTPEELANKIAVLTGIQWGRRISAQCQGECDVRPNSLTQDCRSLYGGIDSDGITERVRNVTSVMAGVAKTHATQVSCPITMRELYHLPSEERKLMARFVNRMHDVRTVPDSLGRSGRWITSGFGTGSRMSMS